LNGSRFFIRAYVAADCTAIQDLWVASWRTTGIAVNFDARRGWLADHLHQLARQGVAILVGLDEQNAPAGFVTIDSGTGHLDQLCVAPQAQGGGLARALLDEAKRRAPGAVALTVNDANPRARRFYEREGFAAVGKGVSALSGLEVTHLRWEVKKDPVPRPPLALDA
jgi:putative acetyltransferase